MVRMQSRSFCLLAFLLLVTPGWTTLTTDDGIWLHWTAPEVVLDLDAAGTPDIAEDAEFDLLATAMGVWNSVPCGQPGLRPGAVLPAGSGPSANWISFQAMDDPAFSAVIAWTQVDYVAETGVIEHASVTFNDGYRFTGTGGEPVRVDLPSIAVHEFGHALGLGHSLVLASTMYPTYNAGTKSQRRLSEDDAQGLCAIYGGTLPADWAPVWPWNDDPSSATCSDGCESIPSSLPLLQKTYPEYRLRSRSGCAARDAGSLAGLLPGLWVFAILIRRRRSRHPARVAGWLAAILLAWPASVPGQEEPYTIEVRSRVLSGVERPALILRANAALRNLEVRLQAQDRAPAVHRVASLKPDTVREFPLDAPPGLSHWTAEIRHAGSREPDLLAFDVVVARPIEVRITEGDVDLQHGELAFTASEPVARVRVQVFDPDGNPIADLQETPDAAAGSRVSIRFPRPTGAVGRVLLTVFDAYGFFNGVEISPFFIEIPHEEVLFEFGRSDIRPDEEPKLQRIAAEIQAALARLKSVLAARLYIAGYTDTVGTNDYNLSLSRRRAEAIAHWFRRHGLAMSICWQGFGEDALAVPTPDETPEPRNRRTLYVLADSAPPVSKVFPRADWQCF